MREKHWAAPVASVTVLYVLVIILLMGVSLLDSKSAWRICEIGGETWAIPYGISEALEYVTGGGGGNSIVAQEPSVVVDTGNHGHSSVNLSPNRVSDSSGLVGGGAHQFGAVSGPDSGARESDSDILKRVWGADAWKHEYVPWANQYWENTYHFFDECLMELGDLFTVRDNWLESCIYFRVEGGLELQSMAVRGKKRLFYGLITLFKQRHSELMLQIQQDNFRDLVPEQPEQSGWGPEIVQSGWESEAVHEPYNLVGTILRTEDGEIQIKIEEAGETRITVGGVTNQNLYGVVWWFKSVEWSITILSPYFVKLVETMTYKF